MIHDCHRKSHAWYADVARDEIVRFADAVRGADLATPVPSCPDWTIGDLIDHAGGVHRWAATMVRDGAQERLTRAQLDLGLADGVPADADWLAAGATFLHESLLDADPEAAVWVWGADPHVRFWSRRMVHETAIHRADGELALGRPFVLDAEVAVDGIDELLENLPSAAYFAPRVKELSGAGESLALRATDAGIDWRIELHGDGFEWDHDVTGDEQVAVSGSALDLLLVLYRRRSLDDSDLELSGEASLFEFWLERSAL